MPSKPLRFTDDEIWRAFHRFDAVELVTDDLLDRVHDTTSGGCVADPTGLVSYHDSTTDTTSEFSQTTLRGLRAAALVAIAARRLLAPGVLTAAVLGSGLVANAHLSLLARHLPTLSHAAVYPPGGTAADDLWVRAQFDAAGIALAVAENPTDAVFGANLVVVTEAVPCELRPEHVPRSVVVINSSNQDLPIALITGSDELYVDDFELLESLPDRAFVAMHNSARRKLSDRLPDANWRDSRHISGALGELLGGERLPPANQVVLVELLGADTIDPRLAGRLHHAVLAERNEQTHQ